MSPICTYLKSAASLTGLAAIGAVAAVAVIVHADVAQSTSDRGAQTVVATGEALEPSLHALPGPDGKLAPGGRGGAGLGVCPGTSCDADYCCVTQTPDNTENFGQVACGLSGDGTTENSFARSFDLVAEGIAGAFTVDSVRFGVRQYDSDSGDIQPVDVNLYLDPDGGEPSILNAVLIDTETVLISTADEGTFIIVDFPGAPVFAAGATMIVELLAPVDGTGGTPGNDYAFRPRATDQVNSCRDSYLYALGNCGVADWVTVSSINFPDSQTVIEVTGRVDPGAPLAVCGNGVLEGCEECDPPDGVLCNTDCTLFPTGACCNFDGQSNCSVVTEGQCTDSGTGIYVGDYTPCDPAQCDALEACQGAIGDCFQEGGNGTPGCDDPDCCVLVCLEDPFCCSDTWDANCADTAQSTCIFLTCEHTGTSCQEISEANASTSMDDSFQVAEKFTPAAGGNVNSICFYGAYLPADLPNIGDDSFTVRYYDCVDGVPTNVLAEFTQGVDLSINDKHTTNLMVAGLANIFEYTATHADVPVNQGEAYFLEIINSGLPDGTTWFWEWGTGANGDGISYQKQTGLPYARYFRVSHDQAFCLNLELADVDGVCTVPDPQPCDLDVAGADVQEGEPCGADPDQNIGCSADAPPFLYTDLVSVSTDPADPTVIHGEAWADGNFRDVDWYRFTAPDVDANQDGEAVVCLVIASELPMAAVVVTDDPVQGECVDPAIPALDAIGFECGASLAVGYTIANANEQLILVRSNDGLEIFRDYPCNGPTFGSDYLMEVAVVDTFEECFPGDDTCPWDLNGDDFVGINDLLILLANWGPNPGHPADFNGDGFVGINDLLALLANWGNCPP
ncbi:MAG: hypothetical protein ACYS0G_09585 [Planctomycetota bacterium]|jgi:hypothetical protein